MSLGDTDDIHAHTVVIGDANDNCNNGDKSYIITLYYMPCLLWMNNHDCSMDYLTATTTTLTDLSSAAAIDVSGGGSFSSAGLRRRKKMVSTKAKKNKRKKTRTEMPVFGSRDDSSADDSDCVSNRYSGWSPLVNELFRSNSWLEEPEQQQQQQQQQMVMINNSRTRIRNAHKQHKKHRKGHH